MLIKQKTLSLPRNLVLGWQIANSVLNKGKYAIPPLFNSPELLSATSDKAKFFAKNFSKNPNLDGSGISLPIFPSRTNLKLHNISVTPKMVKKVMTITLIHQSHPNLSVFSGKNCEPELSYILAELFNIVGRSHQWSPFLRVLEKGLKLKTHPTVLHSVVSKVF